MLNKFKILLKYNNINIKHTGNNINKNIIEIE